MGPRAFDGAEAEQPLNHRTVGTSKRPVMRKIKKFILNQTVSPHHPATELVGSSLMIMKY